MSNTEQPPNDSSEQLSQSSITMPLGSPHISLCMVVATTPSLGIGFKNTLPWPALKAEMAYFARVTKRVPKNMLHLQTSPSRVVNAVLMGRSTYESIPRKFRPLKDRVNIVLTRAAAGSDVRTAIEGEAKDGAVEGPIVASSIGEALGLLRSRFGTTGKADPSTSSTNVSLGRVFVIGGAEVYGQALQMSECDRVLRTRIENEFECDVFFPVKFAEDDGGEWGKASKQDLDEWVGEDVPEGLQSQGDIRWEFEMWERKHSELAPIE